MGMTIAGVELRPRDPSLRAADLFVMRALGETHIVLAGRFGVSEADLRAIFTTLGEPRRLLPRQWCMDATARPPALETKRPTFRPEFFACR